MIFLANISRGLRGRANFIFISFDNLAVKSSKKIFTLNPKYPKASSAFVECTRIDINLGNVICPASSFRCYDSLMDWGPLLAAPIHLINTSNAIINFQRVK